MTHSKISVTVRPYSDASFIVYGEDTKEIKDNLMSLGGRWNPNLKHPLYEGQKIKAYIFSNGRKEKLMEWLSSNDVTTTQVGGSSVATKKREIDPNRPKNDRYTGKRAMIRSYQDRYVIIYGELTEDMEEDLKELGFEKSNTLKNPQSGATISGMKGKKLKRTSLIDFCIMQDVDYTELEDHEEDIFEIK